MKYIYLFEKFVIKQLTDEDGSRKDIEFAPIGGREIRNGKKSIRKQDIVGGDIIKWEKVGAGYFNANSCYDALGDRISYNSNSNMWFRFYIRNTYGPCICYYSPDCERIYYYFVKYRQAREKQGPEYNYWQSVKPEHGIDNFSLEEFKDFETVLRYGDTDELCNVNTNLDQDWEKILKKYGNK